MSRENIQPHKRDSDCQSIGGEDNYSPLFVYKNRVLSDDQLILSFLEIVLRDFKIKLKKRVSWCIF
jgi:hypothetical protein